MDHIAIMTTKWNLIGKIVEKKKTIESRWYKTRRAPWNLLKENEWIYFKESGGMVTAKAQVDHVLQFADLTIDSAREVVEKYGNKILIQNKDVDKWASGKRYVILAFLKNAEYITPFSIDKTGFGNAAAWIAVDSIKEIRI